MKLKVVLWSSVNVAEIPLLNWQQTFIQLQKEPSERFQKSFITMTWKYQI